MQHSGHIGGSHQEILK